MSYILSDQPSLFGQPDVVGFGTDAFHVREIHRDRANAIIMRNHYSKKIYSTSFVHLGIYIDGEMYGVLQFGCAMNPASAGSVVEGTELNQYLELNRMWLDDFAPHCSESRALSHAFKFIKRKHPTVKWVQSFADERCGKFGAVYQASGFKYYGEHTSTFWELDGVVYHNSILTNGNRAHLPGAIKIRDGIDRATRHDLRQFRYLYFMAPRFAKGVKLKERPFPKPSAARPSDAPVPSGASEVQPLGAAPTSEAA